MNHEMVKNEKGGEKAPHSIKDMKEAYIFNN